MTLPSPLDDEDAALLLSTLSTLEAEFHHPGRTASAERLDALLHPAFHEVGRSGRRYDRATVLRYLASQPVRSDVEPGGHAVERLADGLVLLSYRSEQRVPGAAPLRTLRSSLWQHGPAGWQLRYHQGTPEADDAA